jgi:hypothetical protein
MVKVRIGLRGLPDDAGLLDLEIIHISVHGRAARHRP